MIMEIKEMTDAAYSMIPLAKVAIQHIGESARRGQTAPQSGPSRGWSIFEQLGRKATAGAA